MNNKDRSIFLRLLKICWSKQKKYMVSITGILIIKTILPFVTLLSLQEILNLIQVNNGGKTNYFLVVGIYFLSLLLTSVFDDLYQYLQGRFKVRINYDINCIVINKATKLSLSDYENSYTYDKLQRAIKETQTPYICIMGIYNIILNMISLVGNILILIMWKWYIIIIMLIVPIVSSFFTILIGKYEYRVMRKRASDSRKITYFRSLISDVISCKENKVLNTDNELFDKFKKVFQKFIKKDTEILSYKTINSIIFKFLENIVGIIIVFQVLVSLIKRFILIGNANTYINCVWNGIKSINMVIDAIANLYTKIQYIYNLFEFIDSNKKQTIFLNDENLIDIDKIEEIEFINVSFRYRENLQYAVKNVNCKISKNEKIVIVGNSGSGKSTFIKLLCGLYDSYEGEILINGIPLRKINKENYYHKLGVVFQDFIKYEFTFKENMVYGNSNNWTDSLVEKKVNSLVSKGVVQFVKKLSLGLNTQLGSKFDQGVQLSGGEWQQVAFARAYFRTADVYIFDEPSSGLDVITEENMYNILKKELEDSICLLITHRLYMINNYAERALVFNNSQLIEDDTVKNLLNYDSYYRYMYNKVKI